MHGKTKRYSYGAADAIIAGIPDEKFSELATALHGQELRVAFVEVKRGSSNKQFIRKVRQAFRDYNLPKEALFDLNLAIICHAVTRRCNAAA